MIDTVMIKISPEIPYMNRGEAVLFERLVGAGNISVFRQKNCENCGAAVPVSKTHCSKTCYEGLEYVSDDSKNDGLVDGQNSRKRG